MSTVYWQFAICFNGSVSYGVFSWCITSKQDQSTFCRDILCAVNHKLECDNNVGRQATAVALHSAECAASCLCETSANIANDLDAWPWTGSRDRKNGPVAIVSTSVCTMVRSLCGLLRTSDSRRMASAKEGSCGGYNVLLSFGACYSVGGTRYNDDSGSVQALGWKFYFARRLQIMITVIYQWKAC